MVKILTLVGTRPEIIKLSRVIPELDHQADQVLLHTGQNFDYELSDIFFETLGLRRPDVVLETAGETAAETIGNVIARLDREIGRINPDAFLCLGDTNSCLGVIAAKRRKVPIFHMEAGNRCFDQRVPEEINRRIVDHTSDVNLTYTEHARRYLLAEGLRPDLVIKTGSPMAEVIAHYRQAIDDSTVHSELGLARGGYIVLSAHREENVDDPVRLTALFDGVASLANTFDVDVIVSTHPRTRKRLDALTKVSSQRIRFLKPLGFIDYAQLQLGAFCVVSDSGTLTEESSILGFPAITMRDAHERPEGMDEGTLIMCPPDSTLLPQAVRIITSQHAAGARSRLVADYDAPNVSIKVARIILSHIDYVNRVVWGR